MNYSPRVTVACIIEAEGQLLMVEELDQGRRVFNQPAGHLETNESLQEGVMREVREETGIKLIPDALVGVYLYTSPLNQLTYLRFCFCAQLPHIPAHHQPDDPDGDIIACHWLSPQEIRQLGEKLRSPLVIQCLDDYQQGQRAPLSLLHGHAESCP